VLKSFKRHRQDLNQRLQNYLNALENVHEALDLKDLPCYFFVWRYTICWGHRRYLVVRSGVDFDYRGELSHYRCNVRWHWSIASFIWCYPNSWRVTRARTWSWKVFDFKFSLIPLSYSILSNQIPLLFWKPGKLLKSISLIYFDAINLNKP